MQQTQSRKEWDRGCKSRIAPGTSRFARHHEGQCRCCLARQEDGWDLDENVSNEFAIRFDPRLSARRTRRDPNGSLRVAWRGSYPWAEQLRAASNEGNAQAGGAEARSQLVSRLLLAVAVRVPLGMSCGGGRPDSRQRQDFLDKGGESWVQAATLSDESEAVGDRGMQVQSSGV